MVTRGYQHLEGAQQRKKIARIAISRCDMAISADVTMFGALGATLARCPHETVWYTRQSITTVSKVRRRSLTMVRGHKGQVESS
jgi:hypothetical protein